MGGKSVQPSDKPVLEINRPILIVEDNPDIRSTFQELLESHGYVVHTVCHGQEALEYLEEQVPPAAIFLDLWMPVLDGRTFLEIKQRNPYWAEIPVFIFSSDPGSGLRGHSAIRAVMQKPMDLDRIFELLEEHCGRREQTQLMLH